MVIKTKFNLNRIKKNIFGNSFNFSLAVTSQLIYIPLMLMSWGIAQTGYWMFLLTIPTILSFWKLDFTEASRQELTIDKKKDKNEIYSISLIFTLFTILVVGIVYFLINLNFLENFEIFKKQNIYKLNIILILIFFGFALELIANNHLILSQYKGKIYPSEITTGIFQVLERILIAVVGFCTTHLLYAAIIYAFIKIIKLIFIKFIINYSVDFKFKFIKINNKEFKNIFQKSKNIYYRDLSNLMNVAGFTYFIGYFFNAEIVALLNSLQTMFKFTIFRINRVFIDVLNFEFGNFYSKKKFSNILTIYNFQKKINYIFLLSFLTIGYFFGSQIFDYWTINKFEGFQSLIILVILDSVLVMLAYNELLLGMSLNKLKNVTLYGLIINILSYCFLLFFEDLRSNLNFIYYIIILKGFLIYLLNKNYNLNFINTFLTKNKK